MKIVEHSTSFPASGKWGAVADGLEVFSPSELPEDVYLETVDKLEALRREGQRVLDLSVSVARDSVAGMIRVTARGVRG